MRLLLIVLITFTGYSQNGINYKALIKDDNGNAIANQSVTLQLSILENANAIYQESHDKMTGDNGFVILNIGEGTSSLGDFSTIDWSSNPHFLKVEIDIGDGLVDLGTSQFKTVPYALSSGNLPWSKDENAIYSLDHSIGVNIEQPEFLLDLRSSNTLDPSQLNVSNQDKSRFLRFFSGSETFPEPSTTWAPGRSLLFATFNDNTFDFQEHMRIASTGNVGIGITNPQSRLDVNGKIKISDDNTNPTEGTMRYNSTTKNFEGFDGTNWVILNNNPSFNITTVTAPDNSSPNISEYTFLSGDRISFSIDFDSPMNESSAVIGSSVILTGEGGDGTGTMTWSSRLLLWCRSYFKR